MTDGHSATCYPGCEGKMGSAVYTAEKAAVRDGRIITGASAGCAIPFALELIAALKGRGEADRIAGQIVIR
jgi:4-methyl-5(b-hydroxyethyl)-thiazole monophosphate biosynthesis